MAFRMSLDLKNLLCNQVIDAIAGTDGTAGTATLTFYTGTQPTIADSSGTGATLCIIENIGWSNTTSGTAGFANTAGYTGTATSAGTAGWARLECIGTYGTCRIDGDVGTSVANVFTINVNTFSSGGVVSLLSSPIYMA